jgi:hypothetical protein
VLSVNVSATHAIRPSIASSPLFARTYARPVNDYFCQPERSAAIFHGAPSAPAVQSLIEEAEHARIKAMESPNGAAAAVSAITAKAKLAGLWREKVDQHSTGTVSNVWVGWEAEEDVKTNPDE